MKSSGGDDTSQGGSAKPLAVSDDAKPVNGAPVAKKPSVAAKPVALRKSTSDKEVSKETSVSQDKTEKRSTFPTKPSPATKRSSISVPQRVPNPVLTAKPALLSKPSAKHGDMPMVAGYSKSSSGRSFPISKPTPSNSIPATAAPFKKKAENCSEEGNLVKEKLDSTLSVDRSGSGSPEKTQSVNSLIARWNKGDVGAKPSPTKRGGYV